MMITTIPFGSTGHHSTRCIFGGTALSRASQEEADRTLEVLLKFGINHIDTAADMTLLPRILDAAARFAAAADDHAAAAGDAVQRQQMRPLFTAAQNVI